MGAGEFGRRGALASPLLCCLIELTFALGRLQSILTSLFSLPAPRLPAAYYHSLLMELCRLSPSTVAPALGKCVRKLYAGLGSDAASPTLDPEGVRRFAEWFSVHLSNFGFMWGWADWCVSPSRPSTRAR